MKPIKFHPEAELEMNRSARYYEEKQANLGKRFLSEVQGAIPLVEMTLH